ncbi:polysaccharide deacetylase family protein [Marinobacterium sedimentorum]|uniref:polysaccharide deacetylase family protein n=1 Tax=Marinobacterium sedimentorum TaxID=2927804 RepID=UPI0020C746C6|nr:polysaccharide deacetylase family protein [Marinobacterium sedimentorum]MCP8687858.1 polysaccharide deacetylase family protein [Marinobacterium sedimentorum]
MSPWQALQQELDRWHGPATFWWRDDDAIAPGAALDRLLAITGQHDIDLSLAVIPALCTDALAQRLSTGPRAWVLQHGYDHRAYAAPGERKRELGGPRPRDEILQQLQIGRQRLAQLFGAQALDILVPPWNRIDADLLPLLPQLGYRRLSVLGPRPTDPVGPPQVNVHIDIIDWQARRFAGTELVLKRIIANLEARRRGLVDATEPCGLMTHHLDHDPDCWGFLEQLTQVLAASPQVRWVEGCALPTA